MKTSPIPTKRGRPVGSYTYGEPTVPIGSLSLFVRQVAALRQIARARRLPVSYLVREAVDDWLRHQPPQP